MTDAENLLAKYRKAPPPKVDVLAEVEAGRMKFEIKSDPEAERRRMRTRIRLRALKNGRDE